MKRGKRIIAVFLYLLMVALLLGLRPKELFDLSQFLLVLAGGIILYLPSMEWEDFRHFRKPDYSLLARNVIYASYIETFVLLFLLLYHGPETEQMEILSGIQEEGQRAGTVSGILMRNIALGFRPLLYGICIWIALGSEGRKDGSRPEIWEESRKQEKQESEKAGIKTGGEKEGMCCADRVYCMEEGLDTCGGADCLHNRVEGADDGPDTGTGRLDEGAGEQDERSGGWNRENRAQGRECIAQHGKSNGQGRRAGGQEAGAGTGDNPMERKGKLPAVQEYYQYFMESGLTRRETEVALQICKGISNKEIAMELGISETTVKKHVSNIFEKLGVSRREEIYRRLSDEMHVRQLQ